MKKLFLIAFILISSACQAWYQPFTLPFVTPASVASQARLDTSGNLNVDIASCNIGLLNTISSITAAIQATSTAALGTDTKVFPFTGYGANIATNSFTLLGSIASFSVGNIVIICAVNGKIFWVGNNSVSTASAILGPFIDIGQSISFTVATGTTGTWASSSFITTTAASITATVWPTSK